MAEMDLSSKEGRRQQGRRIRAAAEEAGLSLEQLAEEIGCSRALIYQYVSGATLAQSNRLQKIAERTGKSLTYFFTQEETEEPSEEREPTATPVPSTQEVPSPGRLPVTPSTPEKRPQEEETAKESPEEERPRWQRQRLSESLEQQTALADAQESPPDWAGLISTCERIVSLTRELGDRPAEARAHFRMGNARLRLGEPEAARDSLERAVSIYEALGERDRALAVRQSLGNAFAVLGMADLALEQFQAVASSEGWWNRWQGILSIGAVQEQLGQYTEATASFEQAMSIVEENGDEEEAGIGSLYVRANWVNVYLACGDYPTALEMATGCLMDAERLGSPDQYIEAQLNAGTCLHHLGRLSEAGERLRRAQATARLVGDRERLCVAWTCLSDRCATCGDFGGAKTFGKDALQTALQARSRRGELMAHLALGHTYSSEGDSQEALYHLNQAYSLSRTLKAPLYEGWSLAWRAYAFLRAGNMQEAGDPAIRARDLAIRLGAQYLEGRAGTTLTAILLAAPQNEEAERISRRIVDLGERTGAIEMKWRGQWLLGRTLASMGQIENALQSYREAMRLLQDLRRQLLREDAGDTLLEDEERVLVYEEAASLLAGSGKSEEADLLVSEAEWPPLEARWRNRQGSEGHG